MNPSNVYSGESNVPAPFAVKRSDPVSGARREAEAIERVDADAIAGDVERVGAVPTEQSRCR